MIKNKIKYRVTLLIAIIFLSVSLPLFALNSSVVNVEVIENKDENLGISEGSPQYIDSITYSTGTSGPGSLSDTHVDDGICKQINSESIPLAQAISITLNFNPVLAGRHFRLNLHVTSSRSDTEVMLYVNNIFYETSSDNLVLTNALITNVDSIRLYGVTPMGILDSFNFKIDYFELIEVASDGSPQYIDSINYLWGTSGPGSLSNTHADDGTYKQINSESIPLAQDIDIILNFNPALAGRAFSLSLHVTSSRSNAKVGLYVNGNQYGDRYTNLVLTNIPFTDVNSIRLTGVTPMGILDSFNFKIDYFEIVEILDSTPYETNEEYSIGELPSNDWDWYVLPDPDSIQVVDAASYQVPMEGKAIKMTCDKNYLDYTTMGRSQTITFGEGESLLLSFKAQLNKDFVPILGVVEIREGTDILLKVSFRTWLGNDDQRIEIEIADGRTFYHDTTVNQTIDIDIFMFSEPSNTVKYFMCINDVLLCDTEVTTVVDTFISTIFKVEKLQEASGLTEDFLFDDFYLGSGSSYQMEAIPTPLKVIHPMYYLFQPDILGSGYIERTSLEFEYIEVHQQTLIFHIRPGYGYDIAYGQGVGAFLEIPLTELVIVSEENTFEESTNGEDLIIYLKVFAFAKEVTLRFPGTVPLKEIIGLAEFEFENAGNDKIESKTKPDFVDKWGAEALPDEYLTYKQEALSGTSQLITFDNSAGGTKEQTKIIETKTKVFHASISFELLFFSFSYEFYDEITAKVKLEVSWVDGTPENEYGYFEVSKGTRNDYSTALNLPPIHAKQFTPIYIGLQATAGPGQGQIYLYWNPVANYDYYNIYRNGVNITTSTTNSFTDSGLADSTTYTYFITYSYLGEESDPSLPASAITFQPVTPATPGIYLIMIASFGIVFLLINRKTKKRKIDR